MATPSLPLETSKSFRPSKRDLAVVILSHEQVGSLQESSQSYQFQTSMSESRFYLHATPNLFYSFF